MANTLIFGAGSIGNHLAHGARNKAWDVTLCDISSDALERTRDDIYPSRYGSWDEAIELTTKPPEGKVFDVVFVGTPPDSHLDIALNVLAAAPPRILVVEKPLCPPDLENCDKLLRQLEKTGTRGLIGYNHVLTPSFHRVRDLLLGGVIGTALNLHVEFREHWQGIFDAHPWLSGPEATYLGYWRRGGGAGGEHSHALNLWQEICRILDLGKVAEVSAVIDFVQDGGAEYDRSFQLGLKTATGFTGTVVQDVVTSPPSKRARIQGSEGFVELVISHGPGVELVRYAGEDGEVREELFPKTRPDDFKGELDEIERLLAEDSPADSPISIGAGLDTMLAIHAAFESSRERRVMHLDYERGYSGAAVAPSAASEAISFPA